MGMSGEIWQEWEGGESESEGWRGRGVNMVGGDDSETGLVTKKKGNKNRRPVSVPASPQTTGIKRYRCQPHPRLQG